MALKLWCEWALAQLKKWPLVLKFVNQRKSERVPEPLNYRIKHTMVCNCELIFKYYEKY
jgi:hypothetical protein